MKRQALAAVVALAVGLTACSGRKESIPPASTTPPSTEVRLAATIPYQPLAGEPEPQAKQAAADAVQTLTTYKASSRPVDDAKARLATGALPPPLADQALPLLVPNAQSAGDIVYPQLGGLSGPRASVMVVVRQRLLASGKRETITRTIDVRLDRTATGWIVNGIGSPVNIAPAEPVNISTAARQVLDSPNIDLPNSARWDIEGGRVDDRVLALLVGLAEKHRLSVVAFASGHPTNVFGRESISNHTKGRAVDIWAVDGRAVLEQRDRAAALSTVGRELLGRGVTELGGPWDLDGAGRDSFTDTVHQDHLHVGFDR